MDLEHLGPDEAREIARRRIVELASSMVSGEMGLAEGAGAILRLTSWVFPQNTRDADLDILIHLASETDHLPIGRVRSEWSPAALPAKDRELESIESHYSPYVLRACESLVRRFGDA